MGNFAKTLSLGLSITLIFGLCLVGCAPKAGPAPSDDALKQHVTSFNQKTSQFYDEFVTLQIERVRLAKAAQDGEDISPLLDQMEKIQKQAEKAYHILNDLYLLASKIEGGEEMTFIPFFLATPVLAQEKHGLVGTILYWTPVVGRFVTAFDQVSEGVRLGIYKTYQRTLKEGESVDKQAMEKMFKEAGLSKPEDIFSCDPFKLRKFYHDNYPQFEEEVDYAKIAAKGLEQGVLAYVDGILAITSGDMPIPDVPTDVEDYLNIVLGKETVKEYLKGKLPDTGFEILEESVTAPEEPEEKVTIAVKNEVEDIITGVLAGQIQPYDDWTIEEKRAVAEKLNELEEPLMTAIKTETAETTSIILVPEGEWDVLSTIEETAPVLVENAEVEENFITQIVRMAVTAGELVENYSGAVEELDQSTALAPGEVWDWESWEEAGEEPEPTEIKEEPEEVPAEVPEEEALEGIVHLVGTISVNPEPYIEGTATNTRSEGGGTIELFIDVAENSVTGKTTGWVRTYFLCSEDSSYYGESEGKKGCCKDDISYSAGEWMPMPVWDTNLAAEWDGWTVEPGTYDVPADIDYYGFYARPGGEAYEETWEKYGCWHVGDLHGWFVLDTEAQGFFDSPSFDYRIGPKEIAGTPGCTWTATARAE